MYVFGVEVIYGAMNRLVMMPATVEPIDNKLRREGPSHLQFLIAGSTFFRC